MGAAGATGRAGAGVWGGSLFPLGHVRLGGSGYLPLQIHVAVSPCELIPACRRGSRRERPLSVLLRLRNQVRR